MELNFRSDNETPAAPAVMEAIEAANSGSAHAYAEDQWSMRLDEAFSERFETDVCVIPMATGTVCNAIALACVSPPWGSVFCHRSAHIYNDESGAPEFFGNGLRLVPVEGNDGKLPRRALEAAIVSSEGHGVHSYVPAAVNITQSTESGTVYQADEIAAICEVAKAHEIPVHLDGARFANAVASTGESPADLSWRAGVSLMSFGASKNGCMAAEALLLFDCHHLQEKAERLRKRSGHLLSKMRYVSAQLLACLDDDLWLALAGHANGQAAKFAAAVEAHQSANLEFPVQANEVFVRWTQKGFETLEEAGVQFLMWPGRNDLARFVFAHSTIEKATEKLCKAILEIE
ncbi:MAG TPA: beta-eliminating lyase-related protein [Xanthomonadales bacterium]|nr:beta-eliminating lyase-related protein [Xanthomonadales bacterium]